MKQTHIYYRCFFLKSLAINIFHGIVYTVNGAGRTPHRQKTTARKETEMSNRLETAIKASAAEAHLTKQKVLKELKQRMEGLIQQIENDRLWISDLKELHNQVAEAVAKVTAADEKIKTEELFKALR